jgi:hypothetical protein
MLCRLYRKELENEGNQDIEKTIEKQFAIWFKNHVSCCCILSLTIFSGSRCFNYLGELCVQIATLRFVNGEDVSDDLYALSCQPDLRIRIFSACIVGGVRFHTIEREKNRRTQNSGVMTGGTHNGEDIEFYGCLKEIIQLQYNADSSGHRSVVLFQCDWFDTGSNRARMKDDGFFRSINHACIWYKDDPFILSTQATKVFYLKDTKYCGNWRVVQKFSHRHLWNVAEISSDEISKGVELSYQDDECVDFQIRDNEVNIEDGMLADENSFTVHATIVEDLCRQREDEEEDLSEDYEDDTTLHYASDNEERTIHNDKNDNSDDE